MGKAFGTLYTKIYEPASIFQEGNMTATTENISHTAPPPSSPNFSPKPADRWLGTNKIQVKWLLKIYSRRLSFRVPFEDIEEQQQT